MAAHGRIGAVSSASGRFVCVRVWSYIESLNWLVPMRDFLCFGLKYIFVAIVVKREGEELAVSRGLQLTVPSRYYSALVSLTKMCESCIVD